jgi:tetratricopeptide (TPR) repeat protein
MLTGATARAICPQRKIGALDAGYEASFIALDGNPLEDFGAIRRVALRVKQGHVIEVPDPDLNEQSLNRFGYALLNHGDTAEAIAIFGLNTRMFPRSSNVWDSLAEAYMRTGDRDRAILNYRKALELNPANKNAAEMLKKLTTE